jgi:glucokinase
VNRTPVAVGLDIGGTNLRAGLVAADGTLLTRRTAHNPAPRRSGDDAEDALVDAIVAAWKDLGSNLPLGVGIASLVRSGGHLLGGPNIGVHDLELGDRLRTATGTSVTVANDATVAVWGEHRAGAATGLDDVVLVTVGTGVGGGVVTGGRLLFGATGVASELGHIVVCADGRRCPCGARGCLEAYASGRSIGAIASERAAEGGLSGALAGRAEITGQDVTEAAAAGDEEAALLLAEAGRWLGIGIGSLVNVFDPAVVLIGGGAGQAAGDWLLPAARDALTPQLIERERRRIPPVRLATLGDDAGMVGAGLLATQT